MWDRKDISFGICGKAEKREALNRLVRYYREAGHTKTYARELAKNYLNYGKK